MGLRTRVAVETRLIGLEGRPIDEAGMVLRDENGPLRNRKMTHSFLDGAVFIDVAFGAALAVGVSASIHRIGKDVVDGSVGRRDPTDLALGSVLQREGQGFR